MISWLYRIPLISLPLAELPDKEIDSLLESGIQLQVDNYRGFFLGPEMGWPLGKQNSPRICKQGLTFVWRNCSHMTFTYQHVPTASLVHDACILLSTVFGLFEVIFYFLPWDSWPWKHHLGTMFTFSGPFKIQVIPAFLEVGNQELITIALLKTKRKP